MRVFLAVGAVVISLLCSCVSLKSASGSHPALGHEEIDALKGQWTYELATNQGGKIQGIFQIEPSSTTSLSVVGQAYFDHGRSSHSIKNLRGVWSGTLTKLAQENHYRLSFTMLDNPILPKTPTELPYDGTITFLLDKQVLNGHFKDHGAREGVMGTISAHKH